MLSRILPVAIVAFILLYAIIISPLSGLLKFALAIAEMALVSQLLIRRFNLSGEMGLILLRSQKGISLIHQLADRPAVWQFLSDIGVVMCYGLLSMVLMRKHVSWKSFIAGYLLLGGLFLFVAPSAVVFLSSVIKVSAVQQTVSQVSGVSVLFSASLLVLATGGFFLLLLLSLLAWGVVVLSALLSTLLHGTAAISQTAPGGTLLLPGINLPFFEGVFALLVVLIVHEGAHAILARIAKIPILSSGLVLFGVIPIGAFVEPEEARLKRLERTPQTRVLVAGSTANLLSSAIFFLLFVLFVGGIHLAGLDQNAGALPVLRFISVALGLTFALNFVVGTVNLLPIPLFDGYRTLEINIPHKPVLQFVAALTVVAFLLNLLPWLFVH